MERFSFFDKGILPKQRELKHNEKDRYGNAVLAQEEKQQFLKIYKKK